MLDVTYFVGMQSYDSYYSSYTPDSEAINLSTTQPIDLSQSSTPSNQPKTHINTAPPPLPPLQPMSSTVPVSYSTSMSYSSPASYSSPPSYSSPTYPLQSQYNHGIPPPPRPKGAKVRLPKEPKHSTKTSKSKNPKLLPAPSPHAPLGSSTSALAFPVTSQSASHKMLLLMQSSQNVTGPNSAVGSSSPQGIRLKAAVASPAIQAALNKNTVAISSTNQPLQVSSTFQSLSLALSLF